MVHAVTHTNSPEDNEFNTTGIEFSMNNLEFILFPPKADRKTCTQRSDVMPHFRWYVKHGT